MADSAGGRRRRSGAWDGLRIFSRTLECCDYGGVRDICMACHEERARGNCCAGTVLNVQFDNNLFVDGVVYTLRRIVVFVGIVLDLHRLVRKQKTSSPSNVRRYCVVAILLERAIRTSAASDLALAGSDAVLRGEDEGTDNR